MKWINDRTAEFTDAEIVARDRFDELLDSHDIPFAASLALNQMHARTGVMPSDEFIKYLSDNTCKRWGKRIVIRSEWKRQ